MATSKKYSGLPDLDVAPEIYETPELTDDASTVQTGTLRTDSPAPSEEGDDPRLERQQLDRDAARRRFEPHALGGTKHANFSDTVDVDQRKSYSSRRTRRRRGHFYEDADVGSDCEEENLSCKIARLKREAEEVRLELAKPKDGEFTDSIEKQEAGEPDADGLDELDKLIQGLRAPSATTAPGPLEEAFLHTLDKDSSRKADVKPSAQTSTSQPSSIPALSIFADRLTNLESALGLSAIDPSTPAANQTMILPHLETLSNQLFLLSSTLAPGTPQGTSNTPATSLPNLDALSIRIRTLTAEADKLTASRKSALNALSDLQDARVRYEKTRHSRNSSIPKGVSANPLKDISDKEAGIHSELFLSEQASKITALYQVLPTIADLQPLLPVVLERLRSLSVIHAGAAEARGQLDEALSKQGEMRDEVHKWREAVEKVEAAMAEMKGEMKENVKVVGGMVKDIEGRVKQLKL